MKKIIFLALLLFGFQSFGQTIISGKLVDGSNIPIANVSVGYSKVGSIALLGFTKSNKDGHFEFRLNMLSDSVQLNFNHMSYTKKAVVVSNKTANHTFPLIYQVRQLDEVKIKESPLSQRKDTLNYKLESFITPQDRVIADVIRKLPGVEMEGNKILYQGKPIQKYMVNNLDLMEGRYGLINNNMPVDAVKTVQIIENDQPIKILDSVVFSDRASLNIVLKKFTTTGTGRAGTGVAPALWEVKLTPMTFGRTFQMVNSFQSNNTGVDVSKELRNLTMGGIFSSANNSIADGTSFLSLREVSSPNFEEQKWLQNKIFLGSSNLLTKLKDGLELKGNFSFYDDTRNRQGFTSTQYLTSNQLITTSEAVDNQYRIKVLDGGLTLEKNVKKIYLRNYLKFHKRWNTDLGNLYFNNSDSIFQKRSYTDEAILNSLSFAKFFGKQLVSVQSSIEYHNTPQRLLVTPGQFEDILNNGNTYEQLAQEVFFKSLQLKNNLSFMRSFGKLKVTPYIGLNYDRGKLNSNLTLTDQGSNLQLGNGYVNDMLTQQVNLNVKVDASVDLNNWKLGFSLPYNGYTFNVQQLGVKKLDHVIRHTLTPSVRLNYKSISKSSFDAGFNVGTYFGELDNYYNGFIVNQYRSINSYNSRLLANNRWSGNIGYAYKNTIKARFANLRYNYNYSRRDYLFTTDVDNFGRVTTGIVDLNSSGDSHNLTGDFSQNFIPIKSSIKVNGSVGWATNDFLFNGVMDKRSTFRYSGTVGLNVNTSKYVSGDLKTTYGAYTNTIPGRKSNEQWYSNHFLNLNINAIKRQSLHLNNSYYVSNIPGQKGQYFLDVNYRYSLSKLKTTLELTVYNLFDNDKYAQQSLNSVQVVQTYFELRPRQFMLATQFRF